MGLFGGNQPGPADHWGRPYRHLACNGVTVVSGDDYIRLENPFAFIGGGGRTYCVVCEEFHLLDSIVWDDTGENLADYRYRLASRLPWRDRLYLSFFSNLYTGAYHLNLDRRGRPRAR